MPLSIGRYAPSPTGDLHLGNLRTALLAWLYSRLREGKFLLRIEDLDTPRVVGGSADKILHDLEVLGIDWDGDVTYQSRRLKIYEQMLDALDEQSMIYPCYCSRKDIQQAASAPHGQTAVYPGTCAQLTKSQRAVKQRGKNPAIRLRVNESLTSDCGDFVIKRADGLYAYQFAVVVDDLAQGVTDVVRGMDLESSTARQQYLAQTLNLQSPPIKYLHAPLLIDEVGQRMSKRDGSQSLTQWCDEGGSVESLISYFANGLGLIDDPAPLSAQSLLSEITLSELTTCFN